MRHSVVFAALLVVLTAGAGCVPMNAPSAPQADNTPGAVASIDAKFTACQSIANGSTQTVAETTRLYVNLPKDIYPADITGDFTTVQGDATGGYVSNGGLPGLADGAPDGCWSTYVDFEGNGEVDLHVAASSSAAPDYTVTFMVGSASASVGPGEHCGGNIQNAPSCGSGYHCAPSPGSHLPFGDVGGICVADSQVACTMEAKLCPDGSYVGRSGPNCDFAPCPGSK